MRPGSTEPASPIGGIEQTSCFRIVQAVPTLCRAVRPKILLSPKISLAGLVIIVQAQRACRGTRKPKIPPSLIILTTAVCNVVVAAVQNKFVLRRRNIISFKSFQTEFSTVNTALFDLRSSISPRFAFSIGSCF